MPVDPFDLPAAANDITEESLKTFVCVKCKDEIEYGEFFKHEDPTFDYGFYVLDGSAYAVGVEIVKGIDLCEWCVPIMYHNMEKNKNV